VRIALLALEDIDRRPIATTLGAMQAPDADLTPGSVRRAAGAPDRLDEAESDELEDCDVAVDARGLRSGARRESATEWSSRRGDHE